MADLQSRYEDVRALANETFGLPRSLGCFVGTEPGPNEGFTAYLRAGWLILSTQGDTREEAWSRLDVVATMALCTISADKEARSG